MAFRIHTLLRLTIFILSICHSMKNENHKRKRKNLTNIQNAWPEEVDIGMTGFLEYGDLLKFRVIQIKNKNDGKRNFKHKVTYPDDDNDFKDEWLFLDLKTKKYYASRYVNNVSQRYSGEIFDIKETREKKKIENNLYKNNWKFKKSIIGEDDIQSLSTDVTNPIDVVVGMTGYLAYDDEGTEKKLDFIVAAIANEKTDGKHFIIYPDADDEYNSEWLDLDLKNSSYKAYGVYYDDKTKWYEGKIWDLKFPEDDYQPQKHKPFHIYNERWYNRTLDLYFPLKYKNPEFIKENKFSSKKGMSSPKQDVNISRSSVN